MSGLRTIALIAGRELRSYFFQPLAWVILTALLLLNGWNFWLVLATFNQVGAALDELLGFFFSGLLFWLPLLVAIPLVAMRLVAEERQTGTIETLLTAPVNEHHAVLGKYLAALAFYAVLFSPLVVYVLMVARLGDVDLRAAAGGFLGLFLVGGYLLSAALCASALTRNQIVAAVFGFAIVMALFLTPFLAEFVFQDATQRAVAEHLNLLKLMDEFTRGLVDSRRLVYTLSGTAFFLFLATRLMEAGKGK